MAADLPFLYGAQYYRAPTPSREHWEADLAEMRRRGFNAVKFWVQWRWSERAPGVYAWDDLDELLRLAHRNGLGVVLNLILDVMPEWVEREHPDCRMVDLDGRPLRGEPIPYRQIGGYPGPCPSHGEATALRRRFAREAVLHFRDAPALLAWDVWNEPERHGYLREGEVPRLCFCPSCLAGFRRWLARRYGTIGRLNEVWGRCHASFDDVEPPRHSAGCVGDFVDWRLFQAETMLGDAAWRLDLVRELDPGRLPHLHVVADTGAIGPLNGLDDYAVARRCELFGSTMQNDPYLCAEGISAAQGRPFYNAEWHLNYGALDLFPRKIGPALFRSEQYAQLGWGVRGFLFWQYRSETLGTEAPAWGLVRPDGSPRPALDHATAFLRDFLPHAAAYAACRPPAPRVLLWRDVRNEFFHQARYRHQRHFHDAFRAYSELLYSLNVPFGFADTAMLEEGFPPEARLLVLPAAVYAGAREAALFRAWEASGRVLFCEAGVGAYDADRNRFSETAPAFGLAEDWGIREAERSATAHAPGGGECAPLDGPDAWAALDIVELDAPGAEVFASFQGAPVVVRRGRVFYAGTQLGLAAARKGDAFLRALLRRALDAAGVPVPTLPPGLHLDLLRDAAGAPRFAVAVNRGAAPAAPVLPDGGWEALGGAPVGPVPPGDAALYLRKG